MSFGHYTIHSPQQQQQQPQKSNLSFGHYYKTWPGQRFYYDCTRRRLRLGIVVNNIIIIIITTSLGQTVAGNGCMVGRSVDGGY